MSREPAIAIVTRLGTPHSGTFRGCAAVAAGVSREQLMTLQEHGAVERVLADTYRLTAAPRSHDQMLRASCSGRVNRPSPRDVRLG